MNSSELLQVKASAGSGKTYALTERFLRLLNNAGKDAQGVVCAGDSPRAFNWPEIMAVTFTNKAAAEMKERVVKALKLCALELEDGGQKADWEPQRAAALLERILLNYHRLNIRTIDSLLNMLLRLFALEFGLSPDFELTFEERDIMEPVLDRFMERCEAGDPQAVRVFSDIIDTLLDHEQRKGFWLSANVRERMTALMSEGLAHETELDQKIISSALVPYFDRYKALVHDMAQILEAEKLNVNAYFKRHLAAAAEVELFQLPPQSKMMEKESLSDCLNAKSKDTQSPEADSLYLQLQKAYEDYTRACAILGGAYALAPSLTLARELAATIARTQQERGRFLSSLLPDSVAHLLEDGRAVPEAYCRMGGRLRHMLVDEFQDTSRPQWRAMTPLAQECLSKGGGVFYVGDVKQAIYAWRGGDSDLFDEVGEQPELTNAAETATTHTLPYNWRSSPEVVNFNNRFFSRLEDAELLWPLCEALLPEAEATVQQDFVQAVGRAFEHSQQDVPEKNRDLPGYVRMERVPGKGDDLRQATLERFDGLMDDLRTRRRLSDIAVLVRRGQDASDICDRLVQRGIPVITENSLRLGRHPVVRQMAALMTFADTPMDEAAFLEVVTGDELFLAESGLSAAAVNQWLVTTPSRPLWRSFSKAFPSQWELCLEPFFSRASVLGPYDMASEILQGFRVLERHPEAELYVRRFLELIHGAEQKGMGALSTFLEFWNEQAGEEKVPLPEHVEAVSIVTVHKSKGLEYPVVIVPFHDWKIMTRGRFADVELDGRKYLTILSKAIGERYHEIVGADIREALNLLYVAWTRARDELYGFYSDSPTVSTPVETLLNIVFEDQASVEHGSPPPAAHCPPQAGQPMSSAPDAMPGDHSAQSGSEAQNEQEQTAACPTGENDRPGHLCDPFSSPEEAHGNAHRDQSLTDGSPTHEPARPFPAQAPCAQPSDGSTPDSSAASKDATAPRTAPHQMLAWLPRMRVYRHALEDARFDSRMRGKVAHKAFELYTPATDAATDTKRAVLHALQAFPAARPFRHELEQEVPQMLLWALGQPRLAPAMERGRPEAAVLDHEGEAHRPDRLLIEDGLATVLEFKTGAPSTEHAAQTRRYLELLLQLECGPDGTRVTDAVGYIVYLDGKTVEEVR